MVKISDELNGWAFYSATRKIHMINPDGFAVCSSNFGFTALPENTDRVPVYADTRHDLCTGCYKVIKRHLKGEWNPTELEDYHEPVGKMAALVSWGSNFKPEVVFVGDTIMLNHNDMYYGRVILIHNGDIYVRRIWPTYYRGELLGNPVKYVRVPEIIMSRADQFVFKAEH